MEERYSIEEQIVATEVTAYMRDQNVSLQKAYEDKKVPEDMRMSKEKVEEIIKYLT